MIRFALYLALVVGIVAGPRAMYESWVNIFLGAAIGFLCFALLIVLFSEPRR